MMEEFCFFIPWQGKVLLGTTDTPVDEISIDPKPYKEEIDFILNHFNRFSASSISYSDIKSVFAGLRPLAIVRNIKNTSVLSRDHVIRVLPSGLVHVTGGKWTTYRSMAKHTINKAVQASGLKFSSCKTKKLKIHGWTHTKENNHLSVYGTDSMSITQMMQENVSLSEKIHELYPYTKGEIKWIIENEMVETVEDILARRIRVTIPGCKSCDAGCSIGFGDACDV